MKRKPTKCLFEELERRCLQSASPFVPNSQVPQRLGSPASVAAVHANIAAVPTITAIGGITSNAAGIVNGRATETEGTLYNGRLVINDQPGSLPWTITGSGFASTGQVIMIANGTNTPLRVMRWTSTSITVDPSGGWNSVPTSASLSVVTGSVCSLAYPVSLVPAIQTRVYGQCTWWVAQRRIAMGLTPSPSAYGGYDSITASWVPQRGQQLKWTSAGIDIHTAIIENVQRSVSGKTTTYVITISEYNVHLKNELSYYTTTFKVSNGAVVSMPTMRDGSALAASGFFP